MSRRLSRASALSSTIRTRRRRPLTGGAGRAGAVLVTRLGRGGQVHRELAAAPPPRARRRDGAAVQLDEPLHQRQPEAEAPARAVERLRLLHEQIEDALQQVGPDALAGIPHAQHGVAVGPLDDHPHLAAGRRVLERIVDQVPDHLLEPCRVAVDVDGLALDLDLCRPVSAACRSASSRPDRQLAQVDELRAQLDLPGGHAGHVEKVVHQPAQVRRLPVDDAGDAPHVGIGDETVEHGEGIGDRLPGDCAARGRAWRGTRPWRGRVSPPPRAAPRAARRSACAP